MRKLFLGLLLYSITAVLLLPLLVTVCCGGFGRSIAKQTEAHTAVYGVTDFLRSHKTKETSSESALEEYVVGVVAAEMPASFPLEALKAQAVAARTYQIRQQQAAGEERVLYDVGQAYCSVEQQKEKWGKQYAVYSEKVRRAVQETAGEIMVYDGEPILAAFHAQSSGKTENAEAVWSTAVPYLKSVDSAEDKKAPNNIVTVELPVKQVLQRLCGSDTAAEISILRRTDAGTVETVRIGTETLSGRAVREKLGLRSANFTVKKEGDSFFFTTYGYGHGAGMSQYGASFLAEKGMQYHAILQHYYTGISFAKITEHEV